MNIFFIVSIVLLVTSISIIFLGPVIRDRLGRKQIRVLGSLREAMPDATWNDQLKKLEELAETILDTAGQDPDAVKTVKKLVYDFLPALTELVKSYRELDRQTLFGDDIQTVNRQLEDVLTRMQAAFKDMLDSLNRKPVTVFSKRADLADHMTDRDALQEEIVARETDRMQRQSGHTEPSGEEEI